MENDKYWKEIITGDSIVYYKEIWSSSIEKDNIKAAPKQGISAANPGKNISVEKVSAENIIKDSPAKPSTPLAKEEILNLGRKTNNAPISNSKAHVGIR